MAGRNLGTRVLNPRLVDSESRGDLAWHRLSRFEFDFAQYHRAFSVRSEWGVLTRWIWIRCRLGRSVSCFA